MQIVYAIGDASYRRHITVNGTETLCALEAGRHEPLALPVNCDECRTVNGRLIKGRRNEEEAPLVHLASATAIVVNAENHALAMCGVDLGTDPVGHPWANYVTVGSQHWDKVTCDACKARVIEYRS